MENILDELTQIKDVRGTLLVGKDGLVIASAGNFENDPDFVGASMSELFSTAETMSLERFSAGKPVRISLEAESITFIVYEVTEDTILAILAESTANLGIIKIETDNAVKKLQELLG